MSFVTRLTAFILAGLLWAGAANAANVIPNCYDLVRIDEASPPIERGLLVAVDNTIELDQALQLESFEKIVRFMGEGDRVVIVSFSAYVEDQYTRIMADARLDRMLSTEAAFTVPKSKLKGIETLSGWPEEIVAARGRVRTQGNLRRIQQQPPQ